MNLQHRTPWRQTQRHGTIIKPWVPLSYPSKGEISTSHQVLFYQTMNASACSGNIEQLPKILWRRITGKHNRIHGCQSFSTTIDCFSDMLSNPAKERWCCDDADQSKRCWYQSTPFQELQSAQIPNDSRRRDSSKNLQKYNF
jgi:hypothetical protein